MHTFDSRKFWVRDDERKYKMAFQLSDSFSSIWAQTSTGFLWVDSFKVFSTKFVINESRNFYFCFSDSWLLSSRKEWVESFRHRPIYWKSKNPNSIYGLRGHLKKEGQSSQKTNLQIISWCLLGRWILKSRCQCCTAALRCRGARGVDLLSNSE